MVSPSFVFGKGKWVGCSSKFGAGTLHALPLPMHSRGLGGKKGGETGGKQWRNSVGEATADWAKSPPGSGFPADQKTAGSTVQMTGTIQTSPE